MNAKLLTASLMLFTFRAAAQNTPQMHTECRFSDGNTIRAAYSYDQAETRFATEADLIAVTGIDVPAGQYVVSTSKDSDGNWTLTMKKEPSANRESSPPPFPMSVSASASSIENFKISFDHTGGSCKMIWALEKSKLVLSSEFTERNTDMPVLSLKRRESERPKFTVVWQH